MKIMSIVGARPNFMKIAPFVRAIHRHNQPRTAAEQIQHILVHTGQHYDPAMSEVFFHELGIPAPAVNLEVGSGTHAYQVGQTMIAFEKVLLEIRPDWVIVIGDVNATAACSLTARKYGIRVAHIEAGLRSFDWTMPEEINRVVTDRLSNLLFTPDRLADENLRREGIPEATICCVGNIMIDTLEYERPQAAALDMNQIIAANHLPDQRNSVHLEADRFALLTLHRPANVDAKDRLGRLLETFLTIANSMPLIFPVHPRTRTRLVEFGFWQRLCDQPQLILTQPLGYRDMLRLNMDAQVVLTDSGGLQEECLVLGTHCLTMRENTERPITLTEHSGTNRLVGTEPAIVLAAFHAIQNAPRHVHRPELWDGATAERILTKLIGVTCP